MPALALMYGHRMYSPEPTPMPARITLGPSTLRSGKGSGMSLYSIGGRWSLRTSGAYCGSPAHRAACRTISRVRGRTVPANVLTSPAAPRASAAAMLRTRLVVPASGRRQTPERRSVSRSASPWRRGAAVAVAARRRFCGRGRRRGRSGRGEPSAVGSGVAVSAGVAVASGVALGRRRLARLRRRRRRRLARRRGSPRGSRRARSPPARAPSAPSRSAAARAGENPGRPSGIERTAPIASPTVPALARPERRRSRRSATMCTRRSRRRREQPQSTSAVRGALPAAQRRIPAPVRSPVRPRLDDDRGARQRQRQHLQHAERDHRRVAVARGVAEAVQLQPQRVVGRREHPRRAHHRHHEQEGQHRHEHDARRRSRRRAPTT